MSNYLAIATVTEALRNIVQAEIQNKITGATVTVKQPDEEAGGEKDSPRVNIYMYQVKPNKALRNADLPTRDSSGKVIQKPQAAIDLDYMFSFYGNEEKHEPQRLMGAIVSAIHSQPFIEPEILRTLIEKKDAQSPIYGSDLGNITDSIKLYPLPFTLEDAYRIWSSLQAPFALSIAYRASVIMLESDIAVSGWHLPVVG